MDFVHALEVIYAMTHFWCSLAILPERVQEPQIRAVPSHSPTGPERSAGLAAAIRQ